jgi:hypothetical protein
MLSRMKRVLVAASAALLLAGASGAASAQDRAPAPVTPLVWHGQGTTTLDTKVDWRRDRDRRDWGHDRRGWRGDHHNNWRRNQWRDHRDWRRDHHDGRRDRHWRNHRGGWGWY